MKKRLTSILAGCLLWFSAVISGAPQSSPIKTPQLNGTYYVGAVTGFYPSIQSAMTAACAQSGGTVVIPASSSPTDTIAGVTSGCPTVSVTDERGGASPAKYTWVGNALALVSGIATPSSRLPGFVQIGTYTTGTAASGLVTLTLPSATTAGDLIVVSGVASGTSGNGFGAINGVTDNQGNSYTGITGGAGQFASNMSVYWATNIRGGTISINVTCSGTGGATCSAKATEYKNAGVADVTAGSYGIGGTGSSSLTTTHANDLIVTALFSATSDVVTGFTLRSSGQGAISDEIATTAGVTPVTFTSISGVCCNGISWGMSVAFTNSSPPPTNPVPTWFDPFFSGVQTSASQLYMAVPMLQTVYFGSACAGSYASGSIAATSTTAFTIVKHAGGINGTATTLCTVTWSAGQTAATFTGNGGYLSPGDYLEIVGASTADVTLANITVGLYATR